MNKETDRILGPTIVGQLPSMPFSGDYAGMPGHAAVVGHSQNTVDALHKEIHRLLAVVADKDASLAKTNSDLFTYGEFVRNVATAVNWRDMMNIPMSEVLSMVRGHYPTIQDLRAVVARQKEKLENAATYIEGLEGDLSGLHGVVESLTAKLNRAQARPDGIAAMIEFYKEERNQWMDALMAKDAELENEKLKANG